MNSKFRSEIKKDENLQGFYNPNENCIYVSEDLSPEQKQHMFFHELIHYMDDVTHRLAEEGRCDVLGAYLMNLLKHNSLEGVLNAEKTSRPSRSDRPVNGE